MKVEILNEEEEIKRMNPKDCKRFDSCSAPLCPMNNGSGIWYPDGEICRLNAFCKLDWILKQHKIARQARDLDSYYTKVMLEHDCIISKGITGLDPDQDLADEESNIDRWIEQHPKKRVLSEWERQICSERLANGRRGFNLKGKDSIGNEISSFEKQST